MNQNEHEYMHAHGIAHTHEHDHDHDHVHPHDHAHGHDHGHAHGPGHDHDHDHAPCAGQQSCGHDCAGCASADPRAELIALMKYMVGHNAAHANELAQLAGRLQEMGESVAYDQVMQAVSDFEKGNMRLSTVLAALNA